jgi:pilus assembly protein Flp/PilA
MSRMALKLKAFLVQEDGPTTTEYAAMLALIVVVALAAISSLGQSVNATFEGMNNELAAGTA